MAVNLITTLLLRRTALARSSSTLSHLLRANSITSAITASTAFTHHHPNTFLFASNNAYATHAPNERFTNLAEESFVHSGRRYFVDLKRDSALNTFVKISEVKGPNRNSVYISVDDVKTFVDEFLKLLRPELKENKAGKDVVAEEGADEVVAKEVKEAKVTEDAPPAKGDDDEDQVAFVYCTFKKGKYIEIRLSKNQHKYFSVRGGKYFRVQEKYFEDAADTQQQQSSAGEPQPTFKKKLIFVELAGAEKLLRCVDQVASALKDLR